jgi:anti-sigma B factor antagonist
MEWTEKEEGEWIVLKIIGAINIDSAQELKILFDDLLAKGVKNVRLNLKNVPISNSSGIGHILMLFKSLKERNGKLEIRGVSRNLMEMLKLLNIGKLISIREEE